MGFLAKKSADTKVRAVAPYAGVFALTAAIYAWLQRAPTFMDPDSFYHAKMAVLLMTRGIVTDFPWMPFTTLAHAYTDHHFLYHVLLLPFVAALGPMVGTKVAAAVFAALAMTAFYGALRAHGARWPFVFTMLLGTSGAFMFRMNLAKTSSLSIALLMLALIAVRKEKPWALFALSWMYVLLYGGWPIMLVVVAAFLGTRAIVDRLTEKHPVHSWAGLFFWRRLFRGSKGAAKDFFSSIEVRQAFAAVGGVVCGLVINPFFPKNLAFYWVQIVQIAVIGAKDTIGVGAEWYPYTPTQLFSESSTVFLAVAVCITLLMCMIFWNDIVRRGEGTVPRSEITPQLASFFLAALFFVMTLRSKRHIEYFAPFAVFSTALFFSMLLRRLDVKALAERVRWLFPKPRIIPTIVFAYLAFMFCFLAVRDVYVTGLTFGGGIPWTKYKKVAAWLQAHTPDGAIVFPSDWDVFPPLFFYDDRNRYIVGLDPTFLYYQDRQRYWDWANITTGKQTYGIGQTIATEFDSRYVLVQNDHKVMRDAIDKDPGLSRVYQDDEVRVYEVH